MASRDLARTTVEGGQCAEHTKYPQRDAQRSERMEVRAFLRACLRDREWDEGHVPPVREPVSVCHADRLSPFHRWMGTYVGRPWDDAYAAIVRQCDRRTTKGRHLIEGHFRARSFVRPMVAPKSVYDGSEWFAIDADGVVVACPRRSWPWNRQCEPKITPEIRVWLAGRQIGRRGNMLFWFVPVERWVLRTVEAEGSSERFWERVVTGYRQDQCCTARDQAFFASINAATQQALLASAT